MIGFKDINNYKLARNILNNNGYDYDSFCHTLGGVEWLTPQAINLPRYSRLVKKDTPHNTLIKLLFLGEEVPVELVREALQPMTLEAWIEAELFIATQTENKIRCTIRFTPVGDFVLASDSPQLETSQPSADFVMSPGGTSLQLGWSAIRRHAKRMLDLGTGCGYLGLLTAPFSDCVIATDRNERAVMLTRFNALLNGTTHLEVRVGDLFNPVIGELFDLILCNPPFVITPHQKIMFRDSGMRGDKFCKNVLRKMPSYLEEGGFCQVLINFAHQSGLNWREELKGWFKDLGCDVLILTIKQQPIDEYAMQWITTTESKDISIVPRMFEEWMDYYEDEKIEKVSYQLVNMRRRNAAVNWCHIDEEPVMIAGECGEIIENRFRLHDFLSQNAADIDLLDEYLLLDSRARIIQKHTMTQEGPKVHENILEMHGGLRYSAHLDVNVLRFLVYCDGQRPLRELLTDFSQTSGIDPDRAVQIVLPVIRHLLERGYLKPVSHH